MQQRRDVGQLLPRRHRAGVLGQHPAVAGVLLVEFRIQGDLQIAVPALAAVGLPGLAHGTDKGMHHRVGGVVAEKSQGVLHLGPGLHVAAQAVQKRAGLFLVHAVPQPRQVIVPVGPLFPHLIAEKAVGTVGPRGKGLGALNLVMDGGSRLPGGAHMGIAFRHAGFTSLLYKRPVYCTPPGVKSQIASS